MTRNRILLIIQSLLCVALVIVLAVSAIGIYRDGMEEKSENPLAWVYTREKVVAALKPVLPLFLLALAVTVACSVLNIRDETQDLPVKDAELNRNLMRGRVAQPNDAMKKEEVFQRLVRCVGWTAFGVCMLPVLLYMTDGANFPNGDLEQMIGALTVHVFPWVAAGFACLIFSAAFEEKSIRREYEAIMAQIREEKAAGITAEAEKTESVRSCRILRIVLLVLAALLIAEGVRNGSMAAVVNKAIRICTECVGLG